jgi:AICAR transformylase/IMP cyclohydrolase PurH
MGVDWKCELLVLAVTATKGKGEIGVGEGHNRRVVSQRWGRKKNESEALSWPRGESVYWYFF